MLSTGLLAIVLLVQAPHTLTLDQAVNLASEVSKQTRIADATVEQAKGTLKVARSGLFPQLSSSLSYQRTLATEFSGIFTQSNDPSLGNLNLPFGRSNSWQGQLSLSQNLYSGGRIGALTDLANATIRSAESERETTAGQVELDVAQAYYDAILTDRMIAIAEATLQQAEDTVGQVQRQFDFGAVAEFSLLSARVDRDNQIPVLNRARANRDVAYLRLKQLLDIPATEEIQLTSDLESDPLQVPARYAAQFAEIETKLSTNTTIDRAAVRTEAANVERQEANLHQAKAEARPSISAASDYAKVAYPNGIVSGFGDIRTNWTVGFSLTLPLLTGGRQNGNEAIAGAQLKAEREQLALAQDTADLDARTSWAELTAAQSTWQATESTVALARRAYEVAGIRFGLGVSTQLEISDARLQLQIAEANRAQAARDLQVARIRLALLPALPLTRTAPSSTPAIATPASVPGTSAPATGAPASTPSTTIPTGATRREAF